MIIKIDFSNFESNLFFLEKVKILAKHKNILEIGSGKGHLLKHLMDNGYKITGTEANDEFIRYAKENYNIDLIKETTAKLNFEDDSFEVVLSFDVLEHIPEVDDHVTEMARVLNGGGVYLLSTPNKWTNIPFEVIAQKSFTKYRKYHCSLQNYWQLRKLFEKHGFDVEFIDVPVVNEFFLKKVYQHFGKIGLMILKIIPMDHLPYFMRTNFYLVASKR